MTCPTFTFSMSRVSTRLTKRVASRPLTRYFWSGLTSMRAAASRSRPDWTALSVWGFLEATRDLAVTRGNGRRWRDADTGGRESRHLQGLLGDSKGLAAMAWGVQWQGAGRRRLSEEVGHAGTENRGDGGHN